MAPTQRIYCVGWHDTRCKDRSVGLELGRLWFKSNSVMKLKRDLGPVTSSQPNLLHHDVARIT